MKKVIMLMAIVGLFVGSTLVPQEAGAHTGEPLGYHCANSGLGIVVPAFGRCDGTIQVGWHVEWGYMQHPWVYDFLPDIGTTVTKYIEMDLTNGYCINLVFKWKAKFTGYDSGGLPVWEGVGGNPKTQFAYTVEDWHSPSCYGGGGDPD